MTKHASSFTQGAAQPRPPKHRSQAHPGVHPVSALTHRTQRFQPLPAPLGEPPYHYDLETVLPGISSLAKQLGCLVFHVVGDTGGVKTPDYQHAVATAMKGDLLKEAALRPRFFYHLGDVVYFNGEYQEYYAQFYEPYDHYDAPIISIPGNHDGDPLTESDVSLDGWIKYFMTSPPHVDRISADAPRVTLSLPNVYFTLNTPFATFVGLYTNVPEGGSVDSVQQQWLTNEFATAATDKALIVCLHHPIYSFDDHHSGSARMADVVQHAVNDSRRVPNLVLAAHVHDYQRIEKSIVANQVTPFIVAGHGGYYHLHNVNVPDGTTDDQTGAVLVRSDHSRHGYLTLTVTKNEITGVCSLVQGTKSSVEPEFDTFSYPASAITLPENAVISL